MGAVLPPLACPVAVPGLVQALRQKGWKSALGASDVVGSILNLWLSIHFSSSTPGRQIPEGRICNKSASLAASSTCYAFVFARSVSGLLSTLVSCHTCSLWHSSPTDSISSSLTSRSKIQVHREESLLTGSTFLKLTVACSLGDRVNRYERGECLGRKQKSLL